MLQLGGYANHVGSHFWNMQTSAVANNDGNSEENFEGHRLFKRSKEASCGYVPRVILGDLPESTGHVLIAGQSTVATSSQSRPGRLGGAGDNGGDTDTEVLLWDGSMNRIQKEAYPVHPFQLYQQTSAQMLLGIIDPTNAENDFFMDRARQVSSRGGYGKRPDERSITTWCDYMSIPIHSRSYCDLPLQYTRRNFDSFAAGLLHDSRATARIVEEWGESFRYFAEECDTLTTVHVFADMHDGFSVLSREIVQEIREDYRGVALPVWAFTDDGRETRGGGANSTSFGRGDEAKNMKQALQSLSFSYGAGSLLDHGVSAIIAVSPQEASRVVRAVYAHAASSVDASTEMKLGSPNNPALPDQASATGGAYMSSSFVATAIDGLLCTDLHRDAAESRLAYLNGGTSSHAGSYGKSSSSTGTVNNNNSSSSMSDLLFHATNAGRFPVLNLELSVPLTSSPSGLMRRIDSSFADNGDGHGGRDGNRMNPFLSSLSSAARHMRHARCFAAVKSRRRCASSHTFSHATITEGDEDSDDDWLATEEEEDWLLESGDKTLSNVLCVRGDLSLSQFGLDRYLWTRTEAADSNERYNHLYRGNKDDISRPFYLTRCIQRQTPLYLPLSFPDVITQVLRTDASSSAVAAGESIALSATTISALGTDSTVPSFLSAHAAKWRSAQSSGALLSQLQKANMGKEDAAELAETLMRVAGGYKDDLMG